MAITPVASYRVLASRVGYFLKFKAYEIEIGAKAEKAVWK